MEPRPKSVHTPSTVQLSQTAAFALAVRRPAQVVAVARPQVIEPAQLVRRDPLTGRQIFVRFALAAPILGVPLWLVGQAAAHSPAGRTLGLVALAVLVAPVVLVLLLTGRVHCPGCPR